MKIEDVHYPTALAVYVFTSFFFIITSSLFLYDRLYTNIVSSDAAIILIIVTAIVLFFIWAFSGIYFNRMFLEQRQQRNKNHKT